MIEIAAPRSVAEWVGASPEAIAPARVEFRIFIRQNGACAGCGRKFGPAIAGKPQRDHITALINGGSNKESNIQLLCVGCHARKTKTDVAIKSEAYTKRSRHVGITRKSGRPMLGSRASRYRKKINGTVELR